MGKENDFDVVIIGGSYAGLSAAMALGRSMRKVLIIDNGNPCNKYAPRSHNFLTWDGAIPSDIIRKAKEQVLLYPTVKFIDDSVNDINKIDHGFETLTEKEGKFISKKILFATGVIDIMPEITGFSECWGISILHCPYCHGYEERGKPTAVFANQEHAYYLCMVLSNLTKEITLFTNGKATFTEAQRNKFKENNIEIIESRISLINHKDGHIESVIFENDRQVNIPVMYARTPFKQQCSLAKKLGCEITEEGFIKVDLSKKTSVHGIYAAGDNTSNSRTISRSIAAGTVAGMMINGEMALKSF